MKPLVSVLMSAYNTEPFIDEAIRSVCSETHRNIEFLIYDDASTDATLSIINAWANKDSRITVIEGKTHTGEYSQNLITLSKHINGEFFIVSDSDDVFDNRRIETLLQLMDDHAPVSYGQSIIVNDTLKQVLEYIPNHMSPFSHFKLMMDNFICNGAHLIRTQAFKAIGGYHHVRYAEDYELLLRLSMLGPFNYTHRCVMKYRQHANNYSKKRHNEKLNIMIMFKKNLIKNQIIPKITKWTTLDEASKPIMFDLFLGYLTNYFSLLASNLTIIPPSSKIFFTDWPKNAVISGRPYNVISAINRHDHQDSYLAMHPNIDYATFHTISRALAPNANTEETVLFFIEYIRLLMGDPSSMVAINNIPCIPIHSLALNLKESHAY
jgi:glycosyltransferase involved in cell wall biosynthesis